MKLKIYHIILLTLLFISLGTTLLLTILSSIDILTKGEDVMDNLILLLCFIILLVFTVLEISNTFLSFKTGSAFIKSLTFDNKKVKNTPLLFITFLILLFSIAGLIYSLYILFNPHSALLFASGPLALKHLLISIFVLLIVDALAIELFPLLGKEDKSFKE